MQAHAASGRRLVLLTSDGGDLEQAVRVARQLARFNSAAAVVEVSLARASAEAGLSPLVLEAHVAELEPREARRLAELRGCCPGYFTTEPHRRRDM